MFRSEERRVGQAGQELTDIAVLELSLIHICKVIPVTVIEAGPCTVVQKKTVESLSLIHICCPCRRTRAGRGSSLCRLAG